MLIIWGKKIVRKVVGSTDQFCPICRRTCSGEVTSVSRVGHLYYVPLGSKEEVLREICCSGCKTLCVFAGEIGGDMSVIQALEAREREVRQRTTTNGEQRLDAIADVLECLQYECARTDATGSGQSVSAVFQALLIFSLFGSLMALAAYVGGTPSEKRNILPWLLGGTALFIVFLAIVLARMRSGFSSIVRKRALPKIAVGLMPLRPSIEEVRQVHAALSRVKGSVAAELTPEMIMDAIEGSGRAQVGVL